MRLSSCKLLTTTLACKNFVCSFFDILFFFKPIFFLPKNSKIDGSEDKPSYDQLLETLPETHAMINQVCNDVIHPKDFFQEFKNIEKVVDLFAVGVHEDYKRQGIATKLVEKSMEVRPYLYNNNNNDI